MVCCHVCFSPRPIQEVKMSADSSGEAGDWISAMKKRRVIYSGASVPSSPAKLVETPAKHKKSPAKLDQKSPSKLDQKSGAREIATSRAMLTPQKFKSFSADDISKGRALDKYAKEIALAAKISTPLPFRDAGPRSHTYCTLCSGSEIPALALRAFQDRWSQASGVAHEFNHVFGCEIIPDKRSFGMKVTDQCGHPDSCMFIDVSHLEGEHAWCDRHKRMCRIPPAEGLIAGLSCKDLSLMNSKNPGGTGPIFAANKVHSSTSAKTFFGFLSYVDRFAPSWVMLENSDQLLDGNESMKVNWQRLRRALEARGYMVHGLVVDSSQFALPQTRRRSYIVAFLICARCYAVTGSSQDVADTVFKQFDSFVAGCRRRPPSLETVISTCDKVQAVLNAQLMAGKKGNVQVVTPKAQDTMLRTCAGKIGLKHVALTKASESSPWCALLTPTQKQVLAEYQMMELDEERRCKFYAVDVGQSMGRTPTSSVVEFGSHHITAAPT